MDICLTVNQDFNEKEWGYYCHLHTLIAGFKDKNHNVFAVGPVLSNYQILDSSASVDKLYEFVKVENKDFPEFKLTPSDRNPKNEKLGDLLFIHGYDETNEGLEKVNDYQTNFLWLLSKKFYHVINDVISERFTLKNNLLLIEKSLGLPFIPTTQLQNADQLRDYIKLHKEVVAKPYNRGCSINASLLKEGAENLETLISQITDFSKHVFQPKIDARAERQVFFIEDKVLDAVENINAPWDENPDYTDFPCAPTGFDKETAKRIAEFTGLQIGRVDILYCNKKTKLSDDKLILELNGSGSGQFYINNKDVVADYTEDIVKYCESIVSGKRKRKFFPKQILLP